MKAAVRIAAVVLLATAIALTAVTHDGTASHDGVTALLLAALIAVGLVIVGKQPRNAIGWIFVTSALIGLFDVVDRLYLVLDYRQHDGTLALGTAAVDWRGGVAITPFLLAMPTILLFPDGRPASRGWSIALRIYAALAVIFATLQFGGQILTTLPAHPAINDTGNVTNVDTGGVAGLAWVLVPGFLAFWIASVVHQVRAWRRASGEQRAQLKWLACGAALAIVGAVGVVVFGDNTAAAARIAADVGYLAIAAFPVAIGIGILRYRLYEIDRLISRTISYALVTGSLLALFIGLVFLTTDVLPFSSPVGVAASTLAAAALFNPLRARVQRIVDHRFNRARYDAEATVEAFARRLREAIEVDAVEAGLRDAVEHAVAPSHLTLWLRGTP